jgi:hypothetical protein
MESIGFICKKKYCKFARFRTFFYRKTSLERKKNFRLSRGVAGIAGVAMVFWTTAMLSTYLKAEILATSLI